MFISLLFLYENLESILDIEDIGATWIGEILNKKDEVNEIFKYSLERYELMGVIAIGYIDAARVKAVNKQRERFMVEEFVDWY